MLQMATGQQAGHLPLLVTLLIVQTLIYTYLSAFCLVAESVLSRKGGGGGGGLLDQHYVLYKLLMTSSRTDMQMELQRKQLVTCSSIIIIAPGSPNME